MLDFVYAFLIAPLEYGMERTLEAAYDLTGSSGLSLVLLSLAVNIVLVPVYHLAEHWQEEERSVQRAMAAKIAEIKSVYQGRERFMFMRALYRLYGYTPVMSLRTSLGLLIQIPFFFAAYHLLFAAPQMVGHSFGFISDLSRPDALFSFGHMTGNLLPFVMTLVNLFSTLVYTSRLTPRDKVQLYGLSALFLVLLYNASSALLVYWTCNNIFSFFKNIYYRVFVYEDTRLAPWSIGNVQAWRLVASMAGWCGRRLPRYADYAVFFLSVVAFCLAEFVFRRNSPWCMAAAALLGMLAVCFRTVALRHNGQHEKKAPQGEEFLSNAPSTKGAVTLASAEIGRNLPLFACLVGGVVFAGLWGLLQNSKMPSPAMRFCMLGYSLWFGSLAAWLLCSPLYCRFVERAAVACHGKMLCQRTGKVLHAHSLYHASLLLVGVLVFIYSPALLFASDVDFFQQPLPILAGGLLFRLAAFVLGWVILFRLAHETIRPFMAGVFCWVALCALGYTFVATGDYGLLDDVFFQNPDSLSTRWAPMVDALVLLASLGGAAMLMKKAATAVSAFNALTLVLALYAGYGLFAADAQKAPFVQEEAGRLPLYNDRLLGFSPVEPNIVIFMVDAFTGDHLGEIFEKTPEYQRVFEGFTWYPDTVSPGPVTVLSVPAILGGEEFSPVFFNTWAEDPLAQSLNRAYSVLPNFFLEQGFDIALADVDGLDTELMRKYCPRVDEVLVVGPSLGLAYTNAWRQWKGLPLQETVTEVPFLTSYGIFRIAPWVVRRHIYQGGKWMDSFEKRIPSEGAFALLDILPEASRIIEGQSGPLAQQPSGQSPGRATMLQGGPQRGTFKYIRTMSAHSPWQLDPETCMPTEKRTVTRRADGAIVEHIAAETCVMRAFGRWLEWLKKEGIYDNTQIIFVSDHSVGDGIRTSASEFAALKQYPFKPEALLLAKGLNSRAPFTVDTRYMVSGDVLPMIYRENGKFSEERYDPLAETAEQNALRVRTYGSGMANFRQHGPVRFVITPFAIQGSLFEAKNWHKLDDAKLKKGSRIDRYDLPKELFP